MTVNMPEIGNWKNKTTNELIDECRKRVIPCRGAEKPELVERLIRDDVRKLELARESR